MRITRILALTLAVLGLATTLSACQDEGPMEKAGKAIDNAADDAMDAADDAKDKMKDAME